MPSDTVSAAAMSPSSNLGFCMSAGPVPICAKKLKNLRLTLATATSPKSAGSSSLAMTAINTSWKPVTAMVEKAPQPTPKASFLIFDILSLG